MKIDFLSVNISYQTLENTDGMVQWPIHMIRAEIRKKIEASIKNRYDAAELPNFSVEAPENALHGDYATNVAFGLAKILKRGPMEIASAIGAELRSKNKELRIETASPGFINFQISEDTLQKELQKILKEKNNYGKEKKKREKIQIEFISANPTGPLTLANGRGGFLGDVLARVLKRQGYAVEREYYVNDTGKQVITLGLSVAASLGLAEIGENYYRGSHIDAWAQKNKALIKKHIKNPEKLGQEVAQDFLKNLIKPAVKKKMRIKFDRWTSESSVVKTYAAKAAAFFKAKKLTYEKEGAVWLATTPFGDDKDRVIKTGDGFPTYFFNDAAHYLETQKRGFSGKINILGADHHGYVSRIQAIAQIVGLKNSDIIIMQLVRLISGGQEVRMSKRRGTFVTIDELIDEVGQDATRFFFLEKSPHTHLDFNLDLAKEKTQKNPVYYVQYAHARMASILKKSEKKNYKLQTTNYKLLNAPEEENLMKLLARFPEIVEDTAGDYQVQRIPRYALDLARSFHNFYEKHRVIGDDPEITAARLALVSATKIILKNSLDLMGVAAPERM